LGLNLSYVLALPNGSPLPSVPFFPSRTSNYTTTYYIPLEGDLFALLVVPHVFASQVSSSGTILLQFPPFKSLYYDPSIGLAKLLGAGDDSSSNDEPLIIGMAVGGSVAILLVFGVGLLGLLVARWKQKRRATLLTRLAHQMGKQQRLE